MADGNNPATPPAASGGIDTKAIAEAVAAAVAAAVPAAIVEANKPITEALSRLAPQQSAAGTGAGADAGAGKNKPLTEADVARIVGDQFKTFQQTSQQADQRRAYAAEKMKDLPPIYAGQLGNDPAKWGAEEQALRTQYRDHLKAQGVTVPEVGGQTPASAAAGGAKKPGEVVDQSKLNPLQLVQQGLKNSKPAGLTGIPTRTQPDAGAAAGTGAGAAAGA